MLSPIEDSKSSLSLWEKGRKLEGLIPMTRCSSLEVTHVTFSHNQWVSGHMAPSNPKTPSSVLPYSQMEKTWTNVNYIIAYYSGLRGLASNAF